MGSLDKRCSLRNVTRQKFINWNGLKETTISSKRVHCFWSIHSFQLNILVLCSLRITILILTALSLWFFIYLPTLNSFWYFYTICIIRTERWDHNFHLHQTWKKLKSLRLEVVNHELVLVGGKIVTDYQFKELMKWNEMSHIHWRFAICHKYRWLHSKGKTVNDCIVYWVCLDIYLCDIP